MNNIYTLVLITAFIYMGIVNSLAQPTGYSFVKDTMTLKKNLADAALKTKTIQSDFIQEKNLSVMSEKIITKGLFYFKRENLLRWEYTEPFKYLIIMNKDKIFIKDENKENKYDMKSNKMFQDINKMVIGSVQGKILNTGEFKYQFYQNEKFYLVVLKPQTKNLKNYLSTINIYFDKIKYGVTKLNMEELSGDYTNILFNNRIENAEIKDEKFFIK